MGMIGSVITLQKMQNTVRSMIGSHFADNKPSIYASLYELDGDISILITSLSHRKVGITVPINQLRRTVIQLAKYNDPLMIGMLKGKYGTKETRRKINEEDFDDDEIVDLWMEYQAEVEFDD